jgi:GGDEF domain-containing protein
MVTDLHAAELSPELPRDLGTASAPPLLPPRPNPRPMARLTDWRGFHTELQRAAITATQTGAPLSLLMLEPAGSARVNRRHDCEVAAAMGALVEAIRAVIGERGLLARYSDARLAVILIDADLGAALGRAERIARAASPRRAAAGGGDLEPAAAIGIAQFQDDESLGHLIQRTADALNQAKTHGEVVADRAARQPARRLGHVRLA